MTLSGLYTPFGKLALGTLHMVATTHHVVVTDIDINELLARMSTMAAHLDVAPALTRLKNAGHRLMTLTNSTSSSSIKALEHAGLSGFFERSFSVKSVQKFKPAPETYRFIAKELNINTSDICLVACHLWDTVGAQAVGCKGAHVARPHNAILPAENMLMPDITASNMSDLTNQIMMS